MSLIQKEAKNNNVLDRIATVEEAIRALETAVSNKLFQVVIGEEGGLGNRLYSTGWLSLGWPPANVEKLHVFDGNLKVEGNGFEDVTGGTIYLQNKPSLKGASPADDDVAGLIRALGINDANEPIIIADVYFQITDVTDGSEDGAVRIVTQKDGADAFVLNLVRDRLGINVLDPQASLDVGGSDNVVANLGDGAGPRAVQLNGAAGQVRDFRFQSAGVNRWVMRVENTAESGSDAGSDLQIRPYNDGGTLQSPAVSVQRSSGAVQVGSPTGGYKGAGTINAAGDIYKNNSAYTNPDYALELWATGDIVENLHKAGAADYVRLPLADVETYIRKHFRLPGFDSKPKGVFERADLLLEKVEELYTHVIEQQREIDALKARVVELGAG